MTGTAVALADKLETLVGIWGIGLQPTGDRDPFALRRHALGILRMLIEKRLPLSLTTLLSDATALFAGNAQFKDPQADVLNFLYDRLRGLLRERGYAANEIEAVVAAEAGVLGGHRRLGHGRRDLRQRPPLVVQAVALDEPLQHQLGDRRRHETEHNHRQRRAEHDHQRNDGGDPAQPRAPARAALNRRRDDIGLDARRFSERDGGFSGRVDAWLRLRLGGRRCFGLVSGELWSGGLARLDRGCGLGRDRLVCVVIGQGSHILLS